MYLEKIKINKGFLHIPIKPGGKNKYSLQIWFSNSMLRDFYIAITDQDDFDFFFLDMSEFIGKTITLILPYPGILKGNVLNRCIDNDSARIGNPMYPNLYNEKLRPQFHFSSKRGWLNDPNGLVYADGTFHMYYQHNSLGTPHGGVNISWGHAISNELLFWQEKSDAILPWRRDWSIASGSAIVDYKNSAGYGKGSIIAAFTALGTPDGNGNVFPSGGQFLASSVDGGDSFYLFSSHAIVPTDNGKGWRDPKLFRYEDKYIMAVYETKNEQNCVTFYQSDDFHKWEKTSYNMDLFECPDVFPLIDEFGNEKWVLYGADGFCRIGDFDGTSFRESGNSCFLDYGNATYAGQTWNDHPRNKRVHISWIKGMGSIDEGHELGYTGMPFSQCMSIPCELKLCIANGEYTVSRYPIDEVCSLRLEKIEHRQVSSKRLSIQLNPQEEYLINLIAVSEECIFIFGKNKNKYYPYDKFILFENNKKAYVNEKNISLRILADTTTMEVFINGGIAATYAMSPEDLHLEISGECDISIEKYLLKSIWNN